MHATSTRTGGYFALALTSILWGTTWVASKMGITELPVLQMTSIRQFLGGFIIVLYFLVFKHAAIPTRREFVQLAIMGLFLFVFANGLSTWSLMYIPAGFSALLGALFPMSVVLIEILFYKKRGFDVITWTGFALGIIGVGIILFENLSIQFSVHFAAGVLLSLAAMISWSLGTIFITRQKLNMHPYYASGWQMLLSSVLLIGMNQIVADTIPLSEISLKGWLVIIYLVVFGSLIAFGAFLFSVKRLPIAIASLYAYINPIVAMLVGAILLKEKLTLFIFWGSIVTLLGVFLVNHSQRRIKQKA